jgi:hypothetical protein
MQNKKKEKWGAASIITEGKGNITAIKVTRQCC